MIQACKRNIRAMGQPYCCPDLLNKEPAWGSKAAGSSTSNGLSTESGNEAAKEAQTTQIINLVGGLAEAIVSGLQEGAAVNKAAQNERQQKEDEKINKIIDSEIEHARPIIPGMLRMAEAGNVQAMAVLGGLYGQIDKAAAKRWTEKAALAGDGHACFVRYAIGSMEHYKPNEYSYTEEDEKWLLLGATAGDAQSMFTLGSYFYGFKHKTNSFFDKEKALRWLIKAADAGHEKAARKVSLIYAGTDELSNSNKNLDKATFYENKATALAIKDDNFQLYGYDYDSKSMTMQITPLYTCAYREQESSKRYAEMYDAHQQLSQLLRAKVLRYAHIRENSKADLEHRQASTRERKTQILEATALGYKIIELNDLEFSYATQPEAALVPGLTALAMAGNTTAMIRLSMFHAISDGGADYSKAWNWLEKAAAAGDVTACRLSYNKSLEYLPDQPQGVSKWLAKTAESGDARSMGLLGHDVYGSKESGQYDVQKAIEYLTKSADLGRVPARWELAQVFSGAEGAFLITKIEPGKAITYYETIAQANDVDYSAFALERLAELYREGKIVRKDRAKSANYESQATALRARLGEMFEVCAYGYKQENGLKTVGFTPVFECFVKQGSLSTGKKEAGEKLKNVIQDMGYTNAVILINPTSDLSTNTFRSMKMIDFKAKQYEVQEMSDMKFEYDTRLSTN